MFPKTSRNNPRENKKFSFARRFFVFICIALISVSCGESRKIDLRSLAPADSLAYLETKNLALTLNSLTANKTFRENAKKQPDFSAVEGVPVAVIVSGFETAEKTLNDDEAIIDYKPLFVLIADTQAWSWQITSLVENQLNAFVRNIYGEGTNFEITNKHGGKFYVWTAADNRKAFALIQNSRIFFGNDENAIEKCLAVGRGEAESLLKNESFTRAFSAESQNIIANGYVSTEGTAQIGNFLGTSAAAQTSENGEARGFIARVFPQILRGTTNEIVWTARKTENGIEDNFTVLLKPETALIFNETLTISNQRSDSIKFLPPDAFSATFYNLQNPLVAWRGLLLVAAKNTDALSAKFLIGFSEQLFEPYGISNAEVFLNAIESDILTARFDAEGEDSILIVTVKDGEKIKQAISEEINFKMEAAKFDAFNVWFSEDKQIAAAFSAEKLILGNSESVLKSVKAGQIEQNSQNHPYFRFFSGSKSAASTISKDSESALKILSVLSQPKNLQTPISLTYTTETNFTKRGIERKTISDFGFIGTILEQLNN